MSNQPARPNRITIHELTDPTELFSYSSRERRPVPCYVVLDAETGDLTAEYEEADIVPDRIESGQGLRWELKGGPLLADAANALLAKIAPTCAELLDHYTVDSVDGGPAGYPLDEDGDALLGEIAWMVASAANWETAPDKLVQWDYPADVFMYLSNGYAYDFDKLAARIAAEMDAGRSTDAILDDLYDTYQGTGLSDDSPILIGLRSFLRDQIKGIEAER